LRDIAEVVGRRLANHLRELGWTVAVVDDADTPVQSDAKETWHGLRDESGYVTAYRVGTKNGFDEVLAIPSADTWTVLEISGTRTKLRTAAACAIRTTGKPVTIAGAKPLNGRHRLALDALSPLSAQRLEALTGT
jgi:type VII secretion protein EccE